MLLSTKNYRSKPVQICGLALKSFFWYGAIS
jgi:hypothetical protein